jgi:hypothetical protein
MTDPMKFRREQIRWDILLTLNKARPVGARDSLVLSVIRAEFPDATITETRREIDYLVGRKLVAVEVSPDKTFWHAELTRYGIDVVEYTVECEPGIARPEQYWSL